MARADATKSLANEGFCASLDVSRRSSLQAKSPGKHGSNGFLRHRSDGLRDARRESVTQSGAVVAMSQCGSVAVRLPALRAHDLRGRCDAGNVPVPAPRCG